MDGKACALLAVLLVVLILVLWRCARLRWPPIREGFVPGAPATPLVLDAMGRIQGSLRSITGIGCAFVQGAQQLDPATLRLRAAAAIIRQARLQAAVKQILGALGRSNAAIAAAPRTHANCLSFYRGFCGLRTNRFSQTADFVSSAGHDVLAHLAGGPPDEGENAGTASQIRALGGHLIGIAVLIRGLNGGCRRLGTALGAE